MKSKLNYRYLYEAEKIGKVWMGDVFRHFMQEILPFSMRLIELNGGGGINWGLKIVFNANLAEGVKAIYQSNKKEHKIALTWNW